MNRRSSTVLAFGVATFCGLASVPAAQAEDFFSTLFGGFGLAPRPQASPVPLPFAYEGDAVVRPTDVPRPRPAYSGGSQAYCVRTCDGRYFPLPPSPGQSRAATCNSFCPASETKVVYGSNIDTAATEAGKPYSELPNAFRYRNELVSGCTCNGKGETGLAPVSIENDPTLRKGDVVATNGGLMVAGPGSDKRHASLNFSPASAQVRARYQGVPVVASE